MKNDPSPKKVQAQKGYFTLMVEQLKNSGLISESSQEIIQNELAKQELPEMPMLPLGPTSLNLNDVKNVTLCPAQTNRIPKSTCKVCGDIGITGRHPLCSACYTFYNLTERRNKMYQPCFTPNQCVINMGNRRKSCRYCRMFRVQFYLSEHRELEEAKLQLRGRPRGRPKMEKTMSAQDFALKKSAVEFMQKNGLLSKVRHKFEMCYGSGKESKSSIGQKSDDSGLVIDESMEVTG